MQNNRNNGMNNNPYINNGMNQKQVTVTQNTNPYYNAQPVQSVQPNQNTTSSFDTGNFLKGALIGAVGAYLLTNEDAQKKIFKTFAKGADMLGAGIEEMKERLEDAKAELEAEREAQ